MASVAIDPPWASDTEVLNSVTRMVIPMRREFGRVLDVAHFMHDFVYAQAVLEEAKQSRDQQLRERADRLMQKIMGPRQGGAIVLPAEDAPVAQVVTKHIAAADTEAELRLKMLNKYKVGLR